MKYCFNLLLIFLIQNLNSQNLDTSIVYWKNTNLIKKKIIKSDLFHIPVKICHYNKNREIVKMDTLMNDSIVFSYEYKYGNVKNLNITELNKNKRHFCIYDSMGHYIYIASYKNDTLFEEKSLQFMLSSMEYKTLTHYKRLGNNSSITYTNYGYLLTNYKYKKLNIKFDYSENQITYIRRSNINFRKLKKYNISIDFIFKDINKFYPNTTFVLFNDIKNKKSQLPVE
jgi:hypothetical protein